MVSVLIDVDLITIAILCIVYISIDFTWLTTISYLASKWSSIDSRVCGTLLVVASLIMVGTGIPMIVKLI